MSIVSVSEAWNHGISFADISDVGMRRSNNQDSHAVVLADSPERFGLCGHLFVVADGMGAHAAGELASRMAIDRIASTYFRGGSQLPSDEFAAIDLLRASVDQANEEIHRRGQENPEFHNMGTTASAMAIIPDGAIIAHVGDSRIYRLRGDMLDQLTFDHSLVWEMEASGQVHPNSALGQSIPKNVITRSLGPNPNVQVDSEGPFPVAPGDTFLLCSDGLSGQVDDEEIGAILSCLPVDEAARVLVDLANLRGGPDNSTVIIARVDRMPDGSATPPARPAADTQRVVSGLFPSAAVACLLGAGVLAFAGMYQSMVIAILLGLSAAITSIVQMQLSAKPANNRLRNDHPGGGRAPYRRYNAKPSDSLNEKLRTTVDELRRAADEKCWEMDWREVEKHQRTAEQAVSNGQFAEAVRHQAEAIIATMQQLREQHDRAAGETAIDN
ncbi:PP2C family protein-serine/threonine phosphatase [Crateriforma spongiae]|uniref:PP2C family protein-serine/threonine phosphatase n=1 Tax=Crateriforma spongiae TaxID=2724528 RepID=UPI0028F415EB|nr:PP2C family serine/threonine-protein phosphatase [Crateriforma spongiae]